MFSNNRFIFVYLFLILNLVLISVNSATFENVTVTFTSRWTVLYVDDKPPIKQVFISSDNGLAKYFNNQPLDIIEITNQHIPKLGENSIAYLPNATDISLISCGIKKIEPGAFKDLPKLEYLNLSSNLLEEIEDGVFTNLKLDSLYLNDNKISKLGDKVFNNMTMRHLFITHNQLSTWKSEWFTSSPVESINMGYNLLEKLPANAFEYYYLQEHGSGYPVRLWYVILNNNKLKKIDPDAFNGLEEIGYLNLENNLLDTFATGTFRTVKDINNLKLGYNKFTEIKPEIFKDTKLTYVNLQGNQLTCVPLNIVNVTEIYNFDMNRNPVTCECVRSWEKWQKQINKNVTILDNLKEHCIE